MCKYTKNSHTTQKIQESRKQSQLQKCVLYEEHKQQNTLYKYIGTWVKLSIARRTEHGVYLIESLDSRKGMQEYSDRQDNTQRDYKHNYSTKKRESFTDICFSKDSVLLPNIYLKGDEHIGDILEVFLFTDSDDRIVATTQKPHAMINQIVRLCIKDKNEYGIFLDMGLPKDIFMPTNIPHKYHIGDFIVVRITRDKQHRLIAKKDISPLIKPCRNPKLLHQRLQVWSISESPLGVLCVAIPHYYQGIVYYNTLTAKLHTNTEYRVKVTKVRKDGKLDFILERDSEGLLREIKMQNECGKYFCVNDDNARKLSMSKKGLKKELSVLLLRHKIEFIKEKGYQIATN
ncbi:hypothetical protein CQA53_02215 [Helicobacter didelphidarum]|uniref:Conserved virulence factor B first S1 domain-containing protein n=1 Tax=Helicobacter didelphidarum TaxID=2040648 RepID=A0A3D8IR62_9HELI|nr:S1-like domain-containing RNA-binding protein [Helicobacter didelphidarum]RDU67091.1 hypothetical protein CQA53_02215 [Helicobacter didelphidarum]